MGIYKNENKMKTTIEEYVKQYGFTIEDLSEDELIKVQAEVEAINRDENILDGVLASKSQYN